MDACGISSRCIRYFKYLYTLNTMNDVLHGAFKLVKAVRAHRERK